jgi:WD40 repeat protein
VISGSADRTVRLWDTATGRELAQFTGHEGGVSRVAFSPDGRRAISSDTEGVIKLWQLPD